LGWVFDELFRGRAHVLNASTRIASFQRTPSSKVNFVSQKLRGRIFRKIVVPQKAAEIASKGTGGKSAKLSPHKIPDARQTRKCDTAEWPHAYATAFVHGFTPIGQTFACYFVIRKHKHNVNWTIKRRSISITVTNQYYSYTGYCLVCDKSPEEIFIHPFELKGGYTSV
jgi:hypothetical protein